MTSRYQQYNNALENPEEISYQISFLSRILESSDTTSLLKQMASIENATKIKDVLTLAAYANPEEPITGRLAKTGIFSDEAVSELLLNDDNDIAIKRAIQALEALGKKKTLRHVRILRS